MGWQLWYRDALFSEHQPKCVEIGVGALWGLKSLWQKSLSAGMTYTLSSKGGELRRIPYASFSDYSLEWVVGRQKELFRIPLTRDESLVNETLFRLSTWVFSASTWEDCNDAVAREFRLMLVSELHMSVLKRYSDSTPVTATSRFIEQIRPIENFLDLIPLVKELPYEILDFTPD